MLKQLHLKKSLLLLSYLMTIELKLLENKSCGNPYRWDIITLLKLLAGRELFL